MRNLAYNENVREELLDGVIVNMSPHPTTNHNIIASNIYHIFSNFLEEKNCLPLADGLDVTLSDKDRVIPDQAC